MAFKAYIAYAIIICSLFFVGSKKGIALSSILDQPSRSGAQGHGVAHK